MAHSPGAPSAELAALTDRAFEELEAAVQADNEQKTAQALELYGVSDLCSEVTMWLINEESRHRWDGQCFGA